MLWPETFKAVGGWLGMLIRQVDSPLDLELREAQVSQAQFYETLFRWLGVGWGPWMVMVNPWFLANFWPVLRVVRGVKHGQTMQKPVVSDS